jgi:hypothetical protein
MAKNDITFSDMYKLYFNHKGYDSTKHIKDISVTEHITKNVDDDTHVAMPFNICTDNCNIENRGIESLINSGEVDVTIYPNIVFMKFPPNDLILKYNSTVQADGSTNVGNIKCEGNNPFNFEFQLVGMFIITPPSHAFYIPNPSDPSFAIPKESIKAASILIYRSVCSPQIYIGTIINLEADDDYNPSGPNECLYQSILQGIVNIPLKPSKQSNLPLNTKNTLQQILSVAEKNSQCDTEKTNISLNDFMPENTDEFYTWLDPYHREGLFWICYENTIKINSNYLSQFAEAISDNNFWSVSFKSLISRNVQMSKKITVNHDASGDNSINPNPKYQITASISGSKLSVADYAAQSNQHLKQDGSLDDVCAGVPGGTQSSDPVVAVNAIGKYGKKTFLVEVDKQGKQRLGSGGGVDEEDIHNLQTSINDLRDSLQTDETNIASSLTTLTNKVNDINNSAGQGKTSKVTTIFVWFLVIYLVLTIIIALLISFKIISAKKFLIAVFPVISYLIGEQAAANATSGTIAGQVAKSLRSNISVIPQMQKNIANLLDSNESTKQIKELESDKRTSDSRIEELTEQLRAKDAQDAQDKASNGASGAPSAKSDPIQRVGLNEIKKKLEERASQSGGYSKNRKIKRKARIGYKKFRRSQL